MATLQEVLGANGINFTDQLILACTAHGVEVAAGCVLLIKESGGGRNVFGHDAVPCGPKGGTVTEQRYLEYLANRSRCGNQGVGPMQLTNPSLQDRADREGGCWRPEVNIRVGIAHFADLLRATGNLRTAFRRYNGSGPNAERYADDAMRRLPFWRDVVASGTPGPIVPPPIEETDTEDVMHAWDLPAGTRETRTLSMDPIGKGLVFPRDTRAWLRFYAFDRGGDPVLGDIDWLVFVRAGNDGPNMPKDPFKLENRKPFVFELPPGTLAVEVGYTSRVPIGASLVWLRP